MTNIDNSDKKKNSSKLQQLALIGRLADPRVLIPAALIPVVAIAPGCGGGEKEPKPVPPPGPTPEEREEAARKKDFDRLSAPVNEDFVIVEVKQMSDFGSVPPGVGFWYLYDSHTACGFKYAVSATVTDPVLKAELERELAWRNINSPYAWTHELHHGKIAKYSWTIKEPKNRWKSEFLNETSAFLSEEILFRKNMLDEYARQLKEWTDSGKNPNQFRFSSTLFMDETGGGTTARRSMTAWYDSNNNFQELMSFVSQEEADALMLYGFDMFSNGFNQAYLGINRVFGNTNYITCIYDKDEWFQTGLNAMFTYEINGKTVNLFELMGSAARTEFLSKLNAKMELEYQRYTSGYYN